MPVNPQILSAEEMELVQNADILLTKNRIIKKTIDLLQQVQESLLREQPGFDPSLFAVSPKISRGDQYLGLPYVVLDYPRLYHGDSLLFIRTMFWWGHFFSSTLHLSGRYHNRYREAIIGAHDQLSASDCFVGINEDPWQHHFGEENYRPVKGMSQEAFRAAVEEQGHLKIARQVSLAQWDEAAELLCGNWKFLAGLIS